MILASLLFAAMNALIKIASPDATLAQIVLFRGLPSLLLLAAWIAASGNSLINSNATLHMRRNGFGMVAMWCGFFATQNLPLATATTLNYTSPLFIALILVLFMGRSTRKLEWLAIALGFTGVLLVLKPTFNSAQLHYALVGLFAGLTSAGAYLQIRSLGAQGEPEWRTVFFFSLAATATGVLACLLPGSPTLPRSPQVLMTLLLLGLCGAGGQLAMTRAFSRGSTWMSASLQYSTVLFSVIIGELIWQDPLEPLALLGMGLIVACGTLSSWVTARKKYIPQE
jgi:S-adenosylmethionine uptake transporter